VLFRIKWETIDGYFNSLAFKGSVSFLLAFVNFLILNSICIIMELNESIAKENIETIAVVFELILCGVCLIVIVYLRNFYFVSFIFLYQVGIVLNNNSKNKISLVCMILTGISIFFSLFCIKNKHENDDLINNYNLEMENII
jgi:hypothetical protein